jgi:hypothetical protein
MAMKARTKSPSSLEVPDESFPDMLTLLPTHAPAIKPKKREGGKKEVDGD